MAASIQVKGELAVCSTLGTTEELRRIKKLSLQERLNKLEEYYLQYGVNSPEFFSLVKPLIAWTCYKHLRGMTFTEDLVNQAYAELIVAFNGGTTTFYNKTIEKEPGGYEKSGKNIGKFIMDEVGSTITKYRSKNYRRQSKYENKDIDISEKTDFTNFERENYLTYYLNEEVEFPQFRFFRFNKELSNHLKMLKQLKPRNNVLYNFMLWRSQIVGF